MLPQRDPINMKGDLGTEYNCLYTTKELKCKPRDERDPIRLEGNLGTELDPFRPNGTGLPRRRSEQALQRNPILGTGDYSSEGDSLFHRKRLNRSFRLPQVQTDPITHSKPERGSVTRHSMRQFNERWIVRDPILHRYGDECFRTENRSHEMRHYSQPKSGNNWMHNSSTDVYSKTLPTRRPYVHRNPITGEGMRPEDYSDLLRVPSEYYFRNNPTVAHHAPAPRTVVKSSVPATRQARSVVSPPTRSFTKASKSPVKSVNATNKEPPVVKKVIRPKRPATTERTNSTVKSVPEAVDTTQLVEQTNGFTDRSKTASVRKPSHQVTPPKEMSFFEEAQLASENTWDESKQSTDHTFPDPEPTESVEYSESAHSFDVGASDELDQQNQHTEYTNVPHDNSAELKDRYRSFTPNLDRAAANNLFEELQAHERESQLYEEHLQSEFINQRQETTAPLFISTAEEDGDDMPQNAHPGEHGDDLRAQEKIHAVENNQVSTIPSEDFPNDYISAFLKSQPEKSEQMNEAIHDGDSNQSENSARHDEPDRIQSPQESEE